MEMESFLNPNKAMDQGILDELERFWRQNEFGAFVNEGINYLISKKNEWYLKFLLWYLNTQLIFPNDHYLAKQKIEHFNQ